MDREGRNRDKEGIPGNAWLYSDLAHALKGDHSLSALGSEHRGS